MSRTFHYQPDKDAGLGLIYRLNNLWALVDSHFLKGNLEQVNFILDRIYSNLLYRNQLEVIQDSEGDIADIKISADDYKIYDTISNKLDEIRRDEVKSTIKGNIKEVRSKKKEYYRTLMLKDVWLRKFMQSLKLYLKETEHNPSKALFGG